MKVRRIILNIFFFLLGVILFGAATQALSQGSFTAAIEQLSSENVRGYVQPVVDAFGASLNSGLYHTPGLEREGFHARFEIVGSGTIVGEQQRYYMATPPEPFEQDPVRTATLLGGIGATVAGPDSVEYHFQNGQIRTDLFGVGTPQITFGNLFGTEAIVRYAVAPSMRDIPSSSLWGVGFRHSVSQWVPTLPLEVSVGAFRQELSIGDIIGVTSTNVALVVGKSVSFFHLFGAVQYVSTRVDVDYLYTGYGSTPDSRVNTSYSGDDALRWTTGFGINTMGLNFHTDLGFGSVTSVTGTIGLGF